MEKLAGIFAAAVGILSGAGGTIIFIAIGFIQFLAALSGLGDALGTPTWLNVLISVFLAWLPLIGSVTGIYGAIVAWGWWWGWAVLLFMWPFVVTLVSIMGVFGTVTLLGRRD